MKTAVIGGMTSALLLADDGHEVVIFEKENKLGGRLSFMEEGGFRIDQGPTIVLLPDMIESILAEAGLGRDQYEMIRLDPLYKIIYPDGTDFIKHADLGEQEREISRKFPESLAGFQRFMKDMDYRFHTGRPQFLERPFLGKGDYFGIGKVYEEAMVHQFFIGRDFNNSMEEIFKQQQLPEEPSYYTFYPSAIVDSLAPEGKSVLYALIPAPSGEHTDWSSKDEYVDRLISRMERDSFPGLRNHIEWMKVRTPEDALREGLYGGGSFGIAPSLFQSGIFRPQLKPFKEKNIYAVGSSVHPGGGIPIVLQGAKMLADHIKLEHKKNIQTEGVSLDKAAAAYHYCEEVIKNNSATFHRAFSFLPPEKKRAVWAIYAFCRRVDDIVDEGACPEEEVAAFEEEFSVFLEGRQPDQDVMLWTALRDVFGSFDMDSTPFFEMIAGQKMDLYKSRYNTVDELLHYSYHVASTVGLMLLPVLAPENAEKLKHGAIKLGQAMQITNILRDIGDDLKRDRVYLPAALMEKHGYKEEELQSGQLNEAFFALFEELAGIAEQFYEEALETIHFYPPSSRTPVKGAAVLYRAILNKIRKNGYNSFGARNYVTKEEKAVLLATI